MIRNLSRKKLNKINHQRNAALFLIHACRKTDLGLYNLDHDIKHFRQFNAILSSKI